jgi:hypothetical protein
MKSFPYEKHTEGRKETVRVLVEMGSNALDPRWCCQGFESQPPNSTSILTVFLLPSIYFMYEKRSSYEKYTEGRKETVRILVEMGGNALDPCWC